MNSCYGCVSQKQFPGGVCCRDCSLLGSHYHSREDFDSWHIENCTPNAESPENSALRQTPEQSDVIKPCQRLKQCSHVRQTDNCLGAKCGVYLPV